MNALIDDQGIDDLDVHLSVADPDLNIIGFYLRFLIFHLIREVAKKVLFFSALATKAFSPPPPSPFD